MLNEKGICIVIFAGMVLMGAMFPGVGDTFGTCFGPLSRNRKFGYRLGKGETMDEILASTTEVAEGVETSKALVDLIRTKCNGYRLDLKFPILFGIASILEGELTPEDGLSGIMNMPLYMENFDERYSPITSRDYAEAEEISN